MIVYRFEKNGIGPYIGGSSRRDAVNKKAIKKAERDLKALPVYYRQWEKAHSDKTMLFGCPSKRILRIYFGYRFKYLFANGYRIRKYNVPDTEVINIGNECAFPVRYHKLRTMRRLKQAVDNI